MPELEAMVILECNSAEWQKTKNIFSEKVLVDLSYQSLQCSSSNAGKEFTETLEKQPNSEMYAIKTALNLGGKMHYYFLANRNDLGICGSKFWLIQDSAKKYFSTQKLFFRPKNIFTQK